MALRAPGSNGLLHRLKLVAWKAVLFELPAISPHTPSVWHQLLMVGLVGAFMLYVSGWICVARITCAQLQSRLPFLPGWLPAVTAATARLSALQAIPEEF